MARGAYDISCDHNLVAAQHNRINAMKEAAREADAQKEKEAKIEARAEKRRQSSRVKVAAKREDQRKRAAQAAAGSSSYSSYTETDDSDQPMIKEEEDVQMHEAVQMPNRTHMHREAQMMPGHRQAMQMLNPDSQREFARRFGY